MRHTFEDIRRRIHEQEEAGIRRRTGDQDIWEETSESWRSHCPKDESFAAYSEGRLNLSRRIPIWWHIRRCSLCRVDLFVIKETLSEGQVSVSDGATAAAETDAFQHRRELRRQFPRLSTRDWISIIAAILIVIAIAASYQVSRMVSERAFVLERGTQTEAEARAALKDAIVRATKNLQAVQTRHITGELEGINADASTIKADADELRRLKQRWGEAVAVLENTGGSSVEWIEPGFRAKLEATQTAMNELSRALKWYSDVEALLRSAEHSVRLQDPDTFFSTSAKAVDSLRKVEAVLVKVKS